MADWPATGFSVQILNLKVSQSVSATKVVKV